MFIVAGGFLDTFSSYLYGLDVSNRRVGHWPERSVLLGASCNELHLTCIVYFSYHRLILKYTVKVATNKGKVFNSAILCPFLESKIIIMRLIIHAK